MTDAELESLERAARAATPGPWYCYEGDLIFPGKISPIQECKNNSYIAAANPAAILELIAELRQARAERDWLADYIATLTGKKSYNTKEHWIKAARDAVINNPQPHPQYSYEL